MVHKVSFCWLQRQKVTKNRMSSTITSPPSTTATASTTTAAPRTEEIAAGARRLMQELTEFLQEHPSLQTASTVQAAAKSDVPELQLATCRKLREVCWCARYKICLGRHREVATLVLWTFKRDHVYYHPSLTLLLIVK